MALPTWSSGEVLSAADVNSYFVPLAAIKTSDESVTSSTTIQNDDELVLTPEVSSSYYFQCYIYFQGGTAGDIKWQWGVPTGAFIRYQAVFTGTGGGFGANNTYSASDVVAAQCDGAGVDNGMNMMGTLVMGSTSGNLTFKWAQNSSSGTATIVKAQSAVMLTRIA
jgi:hypothetical protein